MRIFCDTASLAEIEEWAAHPWVSGFTTNPTLMRQNAWMDKYRYMSQPGMDLTPEIVMDYTKRLVEAAAGLPISIDGPPEVWDLGPNVWRKVCGMQTCERRGPVNFTAICDQSQVAGRIEQTSDIVSVFAGRIMDTGRSPLPVIDAVKFTGAQVLWASVREPYNIVQAEAAGCDIVTVPPAILRKYLDWHGKPLEVVAEETIAQFDRDREGLW